MWNYVLISFTVFLVSLLYHHYFGTPLSIVDSPETSYDYIVVGAGTSGCVVASRLSEKHNVTVLLVEAGGYFNWLSIVPFIAPVMQGSKMDWAYKTESQNFSSRGLYNNTQFWPRGKGLGGTGQLNFLVHSFGRPEDYERWPKGWSHSDLLPYFKKVSDKLNIVSVSSDESLVRAFVIAERAMGAENVTLRTANSTVKRGVRWSTYHAYLQEAWQRKNLHILVNTLVTKVIFEGEKAEGIEVMYKDGSRGRISARKEVILCAGTVNTPQLLLISGIGPAKELGKHRIPVIKILSQVGRNLFDHLNVPVYVSLEAPVSITLRKMQSFSELYNYLLFGTGTLSTNGVIGLARANDSGLILVGVASTDEGFLKECSNLQTETYRSLFPAYNDSSYEGFFFLVSCLQPKSRGSITLNSDDISVPPKIDPQYLKQFDDVVCTHNGILLGLDILGTRMFQKFGVRVHLPDFEDCRHLGQNYRNIDYAECVMRIGGLTSYHPCGTCKMGMNDDSVVDELLRVRGVSGLRIVDASILPTPISGTPNSVLIAMTERASDLILEHVDA